MEAVKARAVEALKARDMEGEELLQQWLSSLALWRLRLGIVEAEVEAEAEAQVEAQVEAQILPLFVV